MRFGDAVQSTIFAFFFGICSFEWRTPYCSLLPLLELVVLGLAGPWAVVQLFLCCLVKNSLGGPPSL